MTRINQLIIALSVLFIFTACNEKQDSISVLVSNSLSIERNYETVELQLSQLDISAEGLKGLAVKEQNGDIVLSQLVDSDNDGIVDALLFQPKLPANSEVRYTISALDNADSSASKVFSRFVPERTDDYAWENDKVAFRTFGPTAQKMVEEGTKGGTLSSGIDCWLKRVDYPVINIRYKGYISNHNYYHSDHGNGYDPYHVGKSRGCGGIGVYMDNELFVSKNFTDYKTLSNGPLRTSFTLAYADWKAGDKLVKEQKHISLDLGSNLTCINEHIEGVDEITIGITLHENNGETAVDTLNYCFTYWEPMDDSELGTAIVVHPKYYVGHTKVISDIKDESQLLVHLKVIDGIVEYNTGFYWKESKQFNTKEDWVNYLNNYAQALQNPLKVVLD